MFSRNKVLIGIQARSTSKRLPGKVFEPIDGRSMLDHVIDAARKSMDYVNYKSHQTGLSVACALLVPRGDALIKSFVRRIPIIEGSESDVLSRYVTASREFDADFCVRITSDCPLIPPFVITKILKLAVINSYDYISNVDPNFRTALDGSDCECMSGRMMEWLDRETEQGVEREHVTLACRTRPPEWARNAGVIGFFDQSDIKLSVDTEEELDRVREQYDSMQKKLRTAEKMFGKERVHRF